MKICMSDSDLKICEFHAKKMCDGFVTRSFKNGGLQNHDAYMIGKIGEYAIGLWMKNMGIKIIHKPFRNEYKYLNPNDDFIIEKNGRQFQIEARAKARNVEPQKHFECCTESIKPHLVYVFASYNRSNREVDVLGFMNESRLRKYARPILAGTDNCNFSHKSNEYNVIVEELMPPSSFVDYLNNEI